MILEPRLLHFALVGFTCTTSFSSPPEVADEILKASGSAFSFFQNSPTLKFPLCNISTPTYCNEHVWRTRSQFEFLWTDRSCRPLIHQPLPHSSSQRCGYSLPKCDPSTVTLSLLHLIPPCASPARSQAEDDHHILRPGLNHEGKRQKISVQAILGTLLFHFQSGGDDIVPSTDSCVFITLFKANAGAMRLRIRKAA